MEIKKHEVSEKENGTIGLQSSQLRALINCTYQLMFSHVLDRFFVIVNRSSTIAGDRRFALQNRRRSAAGKGESTYCKLEPRQLLSATTLVSPEIVANYRADFGNTEFSYQTNNGPLHTEGTDLVPINAIDDPVLGLNANGGHPGLGKFNRRSTTYDRFAIASYQVQESGYYEITDSFFSLHDQRSGGVEFRVFVNDGDALYTNVANSDGRYYFDTRIGFVAQGDQIHVAFGGDTDAVYDSFRTDFSITRFAGREQTVGSYRADFNRANNGQSTNWNYFWNAPSSADLSTGGLEDRTSYQPLALTTAGTRVPVAEGDPSVGHLVLSRSGGHPGQGYTDQTHFQNRYAIAAFTVEHSGFYAVSDSFLALTANSSDGLEVVVGTSANDRLIRSTFTTQQSPSGFDIDLGNLSQGDTIFVAFGANGDHVRDSFRTDFSIVRILPREAPLRSINVPTENVIHAADFGAIADDRIDDYAAITAAIAAAQNIEGPVRLQFTPGVYNIDQQSVSQTALFVIFQGDDFVFDGGGAQFFVSNPAASFIHVFDSERVILQDFEVDYVERYFQGTTPQDDVYRAITFSQGIIQDVNLSDNSITLNVDPAITVTPGAEFFDKDTNPSGTGYAIDPEVAGRLKSGSQQRYLPISGSELPNSQLHKIYFIDASGLEAGDRFVLQRRGQHNVIGIFGGSNQVTLSGVVAASSSSTFVSASRSSHINILDSHAVIKAGRWKGINADAVHIQDNREGVWVEDSTFDGVGDDVSALYSLPSTIVNIVASNVLDLATVNFSQIVNSYDRRFVPGDKVIFYDPIKGDELREARVLSSETILGDATTNFQRINRVTFDQPITGAVVSDSSDRVGEAFLGYRNDIQVFNRDLSKNGLIQNSAFSNSRRFGTFLMAENVQIVDSTYTGLQNSAIAAHNQTSWPLGNIPRDILLQSNEFDFNGFGAPYLEDAHTRAVVSFKLDRHRDLVVQGHSHLISNLTIADNRFRAWSKTALSVRNAQNVTIDGNEFYFAGETTGLDPTVAIEVAYTTGASVNNTKTVGSSSTPGIGFINRFRNIDVEISSTSIT